MDRENTKMTVERAGPGMWLVSVNVEWAKGEFFSFAIRHKIGPLSVGDLEHSAIALARDRLANILRIPDTKP